MTSREHTILNIVISMHCTKQSFNFLSDKKATRPHICDYIENHILLEPLSPAAKAAGKVYICIALYIRYS